MIFLKWKKDILEDASNVAKRLVLIIRANYLLSVHISVAINGSGTIFVKGRSILFLNVLVVEKKLKLNRLTIESNVGKACSIVVASAGRKIIVRESKKLVQYVI